jgi:hypothetical protein
MDRSLNRRIFLKKLFAGLSMVLFSGSGTGCIGPRFNTQIDYKRTLICLILKPLIDGLIGAKCRQTRSGEGYLGLEADLIPMYQGT